MKKLRVLFAIVMVGLLTVGAGAAPLQFDVRAVQAGTTGATVNNAKDVTVNAASGTVQMQLWAMIVDADNNNTNDGFLQTHQSYLSAPGVGNLLGTIATGKVTPFDFATGSSFGLQADLDADTDLDVGSNLTSGATATNFFVATSGTSAVLWDGVTNSANKLDENVGGTDYTSFLVGTLTFAWGSGGTTPGLSTDVNARPRVSIGGTTASQKNHKFTAGGTAFTLYGTEVDLGTAVHVATVPEPATMAVLGLGLLGLLRRRR